MAAAKLTEYDTKGIALKWNIVKHMEKLGKTSDQVAAMIGRNWERPVTRLQP